MFNLLQKIDNSNGKDFEGTFIESIEELNKMAMKYIQNNGLETGNEILTYCAEATQPGTYGHFPLLRNKTFNNIGCYNRRAHKPKGALNNFKSALGILHKYNLLEHSAVTYLNISAVQSELKE